MKPLARRQDLTIEELRGETIVYDSRNHKAHCLNRTAAAVWQCCDGNRDVEEIAVQATAKLGATVDEEVVRAALTDLSNANLLESSAAISGPARMTRRQVAATAGVMLPVVASILVPTAAAARSGGDDGHEGGDDDNQGENNHDNGKGNGGQPGAGRGH